MRLTPGRKAAGAGAALVAAPMVLAPYSSGADVQPAPFQASASAMVLEVRTVTPGGLVTDTPLDSGGPTGQASLTSLGDGTGYAAFPDPGPFVAGAPSLVAGFLAGTPLSALPTLSYPLAAVANTATTPEASAGSPPLTLTARAAPSSARGEARLQLQTTPLGGAAIAAGTSTVTVKTDGSVIATATSTVQGLTIGPVDLGDVISTATETLDPSGQVTGTSSMTIDGARIGSTPVTVPASLIQNSPLTAALGALGITMKVEAAQTRPGTVAAPVLQLTGTIATTAFTIAPPTYTISLGMAVASLQTSGAPGPVATGSSDLTTGTGAATSAQTGVDTSGTAGSAGLGSATAPTGAGTEVPGTGSAPLIGIPAAGGRAPSLSGSTATQGSPAPARALPASYVGLFDIRSLYLMVGAVCLAGFVIAQLVRWIGVRGPWTSTPG